MKTDTIKNKNYSSPEIDVLALNSEGIFCGSNGAGEDIDPNPDEI